MKLFVLRKTNTLSICLLLTSLNFFSHRIAFASEENSLLRTNEVEPVQATTPVTNAVPPVEHLPPAVDAGKMFPEWEQTLSPSTASPFSAETQVMRVDFSSAGGDVLGLDNHQVLIYGRKSIQETGDSVFAKVVDAEKGGVLREFSLPLEKNKQDMKILGDVSEDHQQMAILTSPLPDPSMEMEIGPTQLSVFNAPLHRAGFNLPYTQEEKTASEISLSDESVESDPQSVRRVEKITALAVDNDGTTYLLGEKVEFRYVEKTLGGIMVQDHFVKVYKDGQFLGEQRFQSADSEGKQIPFNRIDLIQDTGDPTRKSVMVYGRPVEGVLTVLKFPADSKLGLPAPVRIEGVTGDYTEISNQKAFIMNAVEWNINGRSFQIRNLENGEILGSGNDIGTFSFPGPFHRTVWDRENNTHLIFTTKPTAAWSENGYVNIERNNSNRSIALTPLFRDLIGGDKFSLRGAADAGDRFVFSVAKSMEGEERFENYLITVAKKDFYPFLNASEAQEKENQNIVFDQRRRPISIAIPQGKIFVDWVAMRAAFIRLADGTRVDYDEIRLKEGTGPVPRGSQEIAEYAMDGKTKMLTARPVTISYPDGSYDDILSVQPKAIAFFSPDDTLLDVRLDKQSLKESLQTFEAALELNPQLLHREELENRAEDLEEILSGIRNSLDKTRFSDDLASFSQIEEMLAQADTALASLGKG